MRGPTTTFFFFAQSEKLDCPGGDEPPLDDIYIYITTQIQLQLHKMSFLGLGGAPQPSSEQKIAAAEAELDMVTEMFNKLVDNCHNKCIQKNYYQGDVDKNESLCIDRCVAKYFEVNVKVGENMQKLGQSGAFAGRP